MQNGATATRRERILSAASAEFARYGFAGARVERIAAAAGVNKQLLFHYFGSKSGLHGAALRSLLEHPVPAAQPSGPPAERLRSLVAHLQGTVRAHQALLALLASPGDEPETVALVDGWRARAKMRVRQILEDGQRAGYVRDDVDIDSVSEVIVGASLGCVAASDQMTAGRTDRYRETLLQVATEFCSWR